MGCNCKNSNSFEYNETKEKQSIFKNIIKYFFKVIGFLFLMLFLPIIMLVIIWFLFDIIVLNKNVDLGKLVKTIATKIKIFNENNGDDYDEEDDEFLNEENYIALNVEDITNKTK